ncbi:hypothetical protein [Aquitalea magnusonii]|uniref:hypothetical protein n=1 Tax=Aquitalea magnusonii TaxID=332411 RepID=UPI00142D9B09|nr:hypothetical protein [Aquitalea magnusonii]
MSLSSSDAMAVTVGHLELLTKPRSCVAPPCRTAGTVCGGAPCFGDICDVLSVQPALAHPARTGMFFCFAAHSAAMVLFDADVKTVSVISFPDR